MTSKLSRELYFAFIYSKIKYAIEVYGNCSSTNMSKIQILQNKWMKMLLKLDRRNSTNYLHKMLNSCKVNDIYACCLLNFVNDVLCGRRPDVFKTYFEFRRNVYDVRRKGQVKLSKHDCHLVIRLSEYIGLPSGMNYIHLLFQFVWKNVSRKLWRSS